MPNELSDAALDARFFDACWGWHTEADPVNGCRWWVDHLGVPQARDLPVSTDAGYCEAWAMRWAREQGFIWSTGLLDGEGAWAELEQYCGHGKDIDIIRHGTDWKEAFVRACVAAGQIINQAKGGA